MKYVLIALLLSVARPNPFFDCDSGRRTELVAKPNPFESGDPPKPCPFDLDAKPNPY